MRLIDGVAGTYLELVDKELPVEVDSVGRRVDQSWEVTLG